jgi:hypothetical protein
MSPLRAAVGCGRRLCHGRFLYRPGARAPAPLRRALGEALPDGATLGFNSDEDDRTWIFVITAASIDPALTREVLNTALATLNRL